LEISNFAILIFGYDAKFYFFRNFEEIIFYFLPLTA